MTSSKKMNFDVNDPLAELLSDNSLDNDSFFDNPSGSVAKRNPKTSSSAKMEDLFGIKEEKEPLNKFQKQNSSSNLSGIRTSTPRITKQQPTASKSNDMENEDENDDLGFDPKRPKAAIKSNLFDDILGTAESKRPATAAANLTNNKTTMSRQSTDTTTDNSNVLATRPKTSTGRRSSGYSANPDPLGLFGVASQTKENETIGSISGMSSPKQKKRGVSADWLGLNIATATSNDKTEEQSDMASPSKTAKAETQSIASKDKQIEILKLPEKDAEMEEITYNIPNNNSTAQNVLLLNAMHLETQNAVNTLQQQESQLSMTAQLKQQERALMEMQQKQELLLQQQERQFQNLLQQQLQRQHQMEHHIKLQQQRINNHLHLMMSQPALNITTNLSDNQILDDKQAEDGYSKSEKETTGNQDALITMQLEVEVKRLELEKLRLEELMETMKNNYEREIEMLENSYKKQLQMLEKHLEAIEVRLKTDIQEQKQNFEQKLQHLDNENQKLKSNHEAFIEELKQNHQDEIRRMKKLQEDDLEMIREEHRRMIENIRQTKLLEFAVVQENGSYMETLRMATNNLENLSENLQGLRNEMQLKMETLQQEKEKKLQLRELKLEDAEKRLKMQEESSEMEKQRLMELVASLESKLKQLSKESSEENWLLRQQAAALEAEKLSFQKEKEFARDQMQRDEKRLTQLKEFQLVESQKALAELEEERTKLLQEKAMLEAEKKLQQHNDPYKRERLEAEATIKIANEERERYQKMQSRLDQLRHELMDKEQRLRSKESELEQEISAFKLTERKSMESLQKARLLEQNFTRKIQILQQRMTELGEKEANISQERLLLAQERIALKNLQTKMSNKRKCTLCQMSEQNAEIADLLQRNADVPLNSDKLLGNVNQTNLVEHLLDENIAESYKKMTLSAAPENIDFWSDSVLDDDSKELALHKLEERFNFDKPF